MKIGKLLIGIGVGIIALRILLWILRAVWVIGTTLGSILLIAGFAFLLVGGWRYWTGKK